MCVPHPVLLLVLLGLGLETQGWHLVMKVPRGSEDDLGGARSVYDLWTSNTTLDADNDNPMSIQPGSPFKSADIPRWQNRSISLVKLAFYSAGEELAHVVFSAAGSTYNHDPWPLFETRTNSTSWFDCSRIVYSSWADLLLPNKTEEFCSLHSMSNTDHSFSILNTGLDSQSDCDNMTGWFTIMEPASMNAAIQCPWQPTTTAPHLLYVQGNSSDNFANVKTADVFAVFVDDCIDDSICYHDNCWQDPLGQCYCHGYKCSEICATLPCTSGELCISDKLNDSAYSCICEFGYDGDRCIEEWELNKSSGLSTGAIVGICIAILVCLGLATLAIYCFYGWRHKQDDVGQKMTQRAVLAKDFVRRSVHRLSGRNHEYPRRHLREDKGSPPIKGKSEQLSPDSSVVFGEVNPAYSGDDPPTPLPTPPTDRRYTEFPTRSVVPTTNTAVSTNEIQLHEQKQVVNMRPHFRNGNGDTVHYQKRLDNVSHPELHVRNSGGDHPHQLDYERASTIGSTIGSFEKASTMSEMSDCTSTSGYSDYTTDAPANLPPSEMISKDMMPRHKHRQYKNVRPRPRSRASTAEAPRGIQAPQNPESQINYAMERSRRSISSLSSLSSDATHRSDGTQRSSELTKSDVLRARYEHVTQGDPAGRAPRFDSSEVPSYIDIKKQLDADMNRREARERKRIKEEHEYESKVDAKHRMRQVESLDSGIDAENSERAAHHHDGRLEIVRARSADQLDVDSVVRYNSREASV